MGIPVGASAPVTDSCEESVDAGWDTVEATADPTVSRAIARVGTTLHEKWHLDALLGIGGTAVVYAATHRNGSRAAVKILNAELSLHSHVRERFFREGYAANAVGHDGTVKVLDDDEAQDGSLFLVTELLEGESLEQRRVRLGGRLSEADVLRLSDQLLDVIAAAHEKGIVHRDLKPENVFLTHAGQLKVLDFGIAALHKLSTTHAGTITGGVMGTPAYMSPEQALGLWDDVDALSDIWAWGATMFHLLSGELVHDGRTLNEQLSRAISSPAPPLSSVAPEVGPAVAEVVDRALARDREKRWPDARRMQEAVRAAYLERFGTPMTTLPGITASPPSPIEEERRSTPTFRATALPVETLPSIPPPGRVARHRGMAIAIAGGLALAVAVAGTCAHSLVADRSSATGLPSETVPAPSVHSVPGSRSDPAAPSPPVSIAAAPPAEPPAPEASTQPAADPSPPPTPPKKVAGVSSAARPSGSPSKSNASCNPPYVVESETGKRRWKLECL
jgi:eukaryotic-like serine/threonine-protein kinase